MKKIQIFILIIVVIMATNMYCYSKERKIAPVKISALNKAIKTGDIEKVNNYIASGGDVNKTYLSESILLTAIKKQRIEILDILLKSGADPNIGRTPILYYSSTVRPNVEVTKKLLKYNADLNKKLTGVTIQACALAKAITKRNDKMLDLLIEKGADPNAKYSVPLLYLAVSEKNNYAVKKLLEAGADQNKTFMKTTAQQYAINTNNEEIVEIFNSYNIDQINKFTNADNSYGGIGAGIFKEPFNHKVIVYMTLPDSPASVISVGSEITKINNQKTQTMSQEYITNILRGKIGTQVNIVTKDKYNNQHEYTLTRKRIIFPNKKTDKRFDLHWQQIAPDGFEDITFEPNVIINKLSNKYMLQEGRTIQYWFDRKKIFTKGYNACLSYPKNEQNSCLINLVNREIAQTEHDRQVELQEAMIQQQARQNYINDLNQRSINNSLQDINNSIRNTNYNLNNINNSLRRW